MTIHRGPTPTAVYIGDKLATAVYRGDVLIWRRDPASTIYPSSITVTVPTWAAYCDRIALGSGGGGSGGNGSNYSNGWSGGPGTGATDTIPVKPGDVLTITIGAVGTGGAKEKPGTSGGPTTITGTGSPTLTGPGGAGASGYGANAGQGSAVVTHPLGPTLGGSANCGVGAVGTTPGGGGGPGQGGIFGAAYPGGNGGAGAALLRFRSY